MDNAAGLLLVCPSPDERAAATTIRVVFERVDPPVPATRCLFRVNRRGKRECKEPLKGQPVEELSPAFEEFTVDARPNRACVLVVDARG